MRINIGEVTFSTEFVPKSLALEHILKFQGIVIASAKRKNLFLIHGIIFLKVHSVN